MNTMLFLVHLAIAAFSVLLGVLFWQGRGEMLIAAYIPQGKKNEGDAKKPRRIAAALLFFIAFCFVIAAFGAYHGAKVLANIAYGLFFAVILGLVIYSNVKERLNEKNK